MGRFYKEDTFKEFLTKKECLTRFNSIKEKLRLLNHKNSRYKYQHIIDKINVDLNRCYQKKHVPQGCVNNCKPWLNGINPGCFCKLEIKNQIINNIYLLDIETEFHLTELESMIGICRDKNQTDEGLIDEISK